MHVGQSVATTAATRSADPMVQVLHDANSKRSGINNISERAQMHVSWVEVGEESHAYINPDWHCHLIHSNKLQWTFMFNSPSTLTIHWQSSALFLTSLLHLTNICAKLWRVALVKAKYIAASPFEHFLPKSTENLKQSTQCIILHLMASMI